MKEQLLPYLPYLNSAFFLMMAGGVLHLAVKAGSMSTKVDLIMTNHLPHLQAGLEELRQAFIRHIDKGDD